jgi:hypothetical protein
MGPFRFDLKATRSIEMVPADSIVDTFQIEPALRDQMKAAFTEPLAGYATLDEERILLVRLKLSPPPMKMPLEVWVTGDGRREQLGWIHADSRQSTTHRRFWRLRSSHRYQAINVELIPSQAIADTYLSLDRYWGEPIVIENLPVSEVYQGPFTIDESCRDEIERCISMDTLTLFEGVEEALVGAIKIDNPPKNLCFSVKVRVNGRELSIEGPELFLDQGGQHGIPLLVRPFVSRDVTSVDVVLRPYPLWETRTDSTNPPWAGEITIRDVPVERIALDKEPP